MGNGSKGKHIAIAITAILMVALAGFFVIKLVVIPANQYHQAVALREAGDDARAYAIFDRLGNFKDAAEICNEYDYQDAVAYLEEGYLGKAYYVLDRLTGFEKAEAKAAQLLDAYPCLGILNAEPGAEVTLGAYEQDNNPANGPEEIAWTVLRNEGGIFYAVSKYVLDAQVYNTHNGDGSTLKAWLKDDFHNAAFGELPERFVSKVGMLSRDDMSTYARMVNTTPEWTAYAKARGPENHSYDGYCWWLDGDYFHGFGDADVLMDVVTEDGNYMVNSSAITSVNGVRPTIIVDCVSADRDYYADDYDDMEAAGITTRTEAQVDAEVDKILGSSSGKTECSRCNGTGKVTQHFGNSWNKKEGYRYGEKCGGCNGTGYVG